MTRPLDLADELAQLVNPLPQQDLDPEAAGLGDGDLLNAAPLDPQLEALLGDAGATARAAAAGRRRGVAADIALEGGEYRGRVSSRAALFGNGDDAGSSSDGEEGSSSDGEDDGEQQQQQQDDVQEHGRPQFTSPSRLRVVAVSPDRDLSRYKTMFVNGHHHPGAPGKDDTTDDSSSTDSDSDDNQQQDEQQLMNGHHHDQQELQAQQQEYVRIDQQQQQQDRQVSPAPLQQQQQQQQASPAAGSGSGEDSEADEQPPAADDEQQWHAAAAAAEVSSDGGEGSEVDEEAEEGSEGIEQQVEQQGLAGQQSDDSEGSEDEGGEGNEPGSQQEDEDADEADAMELAAPAAAAAAAAAADGGDGEVDRVAAAAAAAAMLGEAAEMQELEREAAAVRAEAEQQLVAAAAGGDRQAAKAAGVRAQQRLWGNALELRIRLQKAVNGANRLPRPAAAAAFQSGNSQVAKSYKQLQAACQETLETMLQLHDALAQQHPAAAAALAAAAATKQQEQQPAAAAGSKRSRAAAGVDGEDGSEPARKYAGVCSSAAAAWSAVEGAIESMAGFRDASLDKWHRRTVLSSGTAALRGSSGLRALQQSISTQVSQLMSADRAKLIARSQLPVQLAPRPLGHPAAAAAADSQQQQEGADEDAGGARGSERARDAETYDEGDFYSQLLKELLESAPAGSAPSQLASARPAKRRKVVDRRASKGRKLRFHTMDKLVGFMAPKEMVLPPFAEQLFGNLFSHEG